MSIADEIYGELEIVEELEKIKTKDPERYFYLTKKIHNIIFPSYNVAAIIFAILLVFTLAILAEVIQNLA